MVECVKRIGFRVKNSELGVRSLVFGVWSLAFRVWSCNSRFSVKNLRCMFWRKLF
jgi:hypothetical protein